MAFGSIIRKLTAFLSPKEHPEPPPRPTQPSEAGKELGRQQQKWEPLDVRSANAAPPAAKKSAEKVSVKAEALPQQPADKEQQAKSQEKAAPEKPKGRGHKAAAGNSTVQYFKQNRKALALLVAVIVTLLFYRYVIPVYVILIFIAIASASKMTQDWIPFVVGFDLVMFFMVLAGVAYGWKAALIIGPVSSLIGSSLRRVSSQMFDAIALPPVSYGIVAALIPFLPEMSLFWIGMACTLAYVVLQNIIFAYLRPDIFNHATFTITTILFNYWLFKNFAEPLLSAISVG